MRVFCSIALLLCIPALASAGIPDPAGNSSASVAGPGCILITPAGTGPTLASRGLTVTVTVRDASNLPVAGYPFQDISLTGGPIEVFICNGGSVADGNTDANGVTTISGRLAGGGTSFANARVLLAGVEIPDVILPIDFVSPDFNGNLSISIEDLGPFALEYANGVYDARADFNCDGVESLPDVGLFSLHNGESCP